MMGLTMCEGKFVGRDEIAMVPTPTATASWRPVPHSEVIDAVTDVVKAHRWTILDEQYGLARDGQEVHTEAVLQGTQDELFLLIQDCFIHVLPSFRSLKKGTAP